MQWATAARGAKGMVNSFPSSFFALARYVSLIKSIFVSLCMRRRHNRNPDSRMLSADRKRFRGHSVWCSGKLSKAQKPMDTSVSLNLLFKLLVND